jgi:nucleoside-diphosphate-sugar epimerase
MGFRRWAKELRGMTGERLKVLYVGGTGTISASCVRASVAGGAQVSVLNRGRSASLRPLPGDVTAAYGDLADPESVRRALDGQDFDVVVDFLCFDATGARRAVELFRDRTRQYVFISSASIYHKPVRRVPITESTPRHNPFSSYSRAKIGAEEVLNAAYEAEEFPVTIVRPSHTYDDAHPPLPGDWTVVDRIVHGAEIVVPGDGTSLWTLTHSDDFAQGLAGLLGNPLVLGETFHITSDEVYTWNQIYETIAAAAGVPARLVHVPSDFLPLGAPDWFWSELILGDLQHSVILDNTKIRRYVPGFAPAITFGAAVPRMLRWREEHPAATRPDPQTTEVMDRLVRGYHRAAQVFTELAPTAQPSPA